MVRFIVDTVGSKRDLYGNRYFFSRIRSTKTGKILEVRSDGEQNTPNQIKRLFALDWSEIHSTSSEIPKRQWETMAKNIPFLDRDLEKDRKPSRLLKSIEKKG